jgi:hypothetical protein
VLGYNWNRERNQEFYDSQDFYTNTPTWQPARNASHRFTGAAIYELPFGKGRRFGSNMNKAVEGVLGGWSVSSLYTFNTGVPLRWGGLLVDGDPTLSSPTQTQWFDTSKIKILPNFTRRSNPLQYGDLRGPRFWNVDATLAKSFQVLPERLRFEIRGEAYNLTNRFPANDPDQGVTSRTFGKIISQRSGVYGRQIQFQGKFIF